MQRVIVRTLKEKTILVEYKTEKVTKHADLYRLVLDRFKDLLKEKNEVKVRLSATTLMQLYGRYALDYGANFNFDVIVILIDDDKNVVLKSETVECSNLPVCKGLLEDMRKQSSPGNAKGVVAKPVKKAKGLGGQIDMF